MQNAKPIIPATGTKLSDDEAVEYVLQGQKEYFEILLRRYNQRLFRIIRSYVLSEDDVRDVMQEAYIKAYVRLRQFDHRASFATWLVRIAINEALQHLRKNKKSIHYYENAATADFILNLPDTNQMNPEKQTISTQNRAFVENAVDQLPEKYKVVFVLHQSEELTNFEIAQYLEISEGNVKVRLHRAKKLLKESFLKITGDTSIFEFGNEKCDAVVDHVLARIAPY